MKRAAFAVACLAVASLCGGAPAAFAADALTPHLTTFLGTPQGGRLETIVYLPERPGPFPTIAVRTPYRIPIEPPGGTVGSVQYGDADRTIGWRPYLDAGYAVVMQNMPGRFQSTGIDSGFDNARAEGAALSTWIAQQPWSNGKLAFVGASANGIAALHAAASGHPAIKTVFATVACGNLMKHVNREEWGGTVLETTLLWSLSEMREMNPDHFQKIALDEPTAMQLRQQAAQAFRQLLSDKDPSISALWLQRPLSEFPLVSAGLPTWKRTFDDAQYAQRWQQYDVNRDITVPVFRAGMWQDVFLDCMLDEHVPARGDKLLVLRGTHYDIHKPATWPVTPMQAWLDQHLKGLPELVPAVRFNVQNGDGALIESAAWPPSTSQASMLYLSPQGQLTRDPVGAAGIGTLVADPLHPVPTVGGRNLAIKAGPLDQSVLDARTDILRFETEAQPRALTLAGPVELEVTAVPATPDADIVANLIDIAPSGKKEIIAEGRTRLRYLNGVVNAAPVKPGTPLKLVVRIGNVAWALAPGHRLGLSIAGSSFPHFDINANVDENSFTSVRTRIASTTLLTSAREPAVLRFRTLD